MHGKQTYKVLKKENVNCSTKNNIVLDLNIFNYFAKPNNYNMHFF